MSHLLPNQAWPGGQAERPRTIARSPMQGVMKVVRALVLLVGLIAVALAAGFVAFAGSIASARVPEDPRAEGIVVLTGGSARIDGALHLLAEGRAQRLLISGVNPNVSLKELAGTLDKELEQPLACCVDLGRDARDTIGNASETRDWARAKGFRSLIVVTSDYHMPRSITELAEVMPEMKLIPYPVTNPDLHLASWWTSPEALALLAREYGKYLVAFARAQFGEPATSNAKDR
jgi:uncharacterized SAM-binding protein YcdF (DUF218 family)